MKKIIKKLIFFLAASVNSGAESTCCYDRLIIGLHVSFRSTVAEHLLWQDLEAIDEKNPKGTQKIEVGGR